MFNSSLFSFVLFVSKLPQLLLFVEEIRGKFLSSNISKDQVFLHPLSLF